MYTAISAIDKDGHIGYNGGLPWKYSNEDMWWFKDNTYNGIIVMGRKTWDSIKRIPLSYKTNVVLTKQPWFDLTHFQEYDRLHIINHITEIQVLQHRLQKGVFICGGQQIYELFFQSNLVDRVLLTRFNQSYKSDTVFPIDYLKDFKAPTIIREYPECRMEEYLK